MVFALTLGSVTFLLAVVWGEPLIEAMKRLRLGKNIRHDVPESHREKQGTPAMGGILIIGWTLLTSLVVNIVQLVHRTDVGFSALLPLGVMVAYGILGGIDDYMGFRVRRDGMSSRTKLIVQWLIAFVAAFILYYSANGGNGWTAIPTVDVPEEGVEGVGFLLNMPVWAYIPLAAFIITGTSNAVNIQDGLDGLAGMISATCFVAYGIIAFLQGQAFLLTFCMTVMGALFAFLWYNAKPAHMFMGDVGSQALGGALAVVALMTYQWMILPIIAIMPVVSLLSSFLQVRYYKATKDENGVGKRLFRRAPLHHHFEEAGWSQTQIVQRWWLLTVLAGMIGVALAIV